MTNQVSLPNNEGQIGSFVMRCNLVYQCGLANVFQIYPDGSHKRILQSDYRGCEMFIYGLYAAGAIIGVFHSDVAGDCSAQPWHPGAGDMFRDHKNPPKTN